ncbi:MAG: hypothetical protein GY801_34740 [bacterium]|nr:hypothetical protein [bacterium]
MPYLKYLLNVDPGDVSLATMEPRERRAGILDGLRALLQEESRTRPLLLVVEDLHWIDEQSQNTLETLMDVIPSTTILLLTTYRPEYHHSLGERSYIRRLTLTDLPPEESMALALGVLSGTVLPLELGRLIMGKGEGNPFYRCSDN